MPASQSRYISQPSVLVRESVLFNYFSGVLLLGFGLLCLYDHPRAWYLWLALLVGGGGSLFRAVRNPVLLDIGPSGIYWYDEFITDWNDFVRARINTEEVQRRRGVYLQQVLLIDHRHADGNVYRRRIVLPDSRNLDDKAIIAAIAKFGLEPDIVELQ
ncbi:hypothetical protein [Flaviaesturariibacter terrae]